MKNMAKNEIVLNPYHSNARRCWCWCISHGPLVEIGGISKGLLSENLCPPWTNVFWCLSGSGESPPPEKEDLDPHIGVSTFSLVATFILKFFFTIVCRFYCEAIIVISATSRCFRSIQFTLYAYSCASSSHWGCFSSWVDSIYKEWIFWT